MNIITAKRFPGRRATPARHQQGVVLIISLILLMVLTLIGVTAMQTSTLEERMAGNAWDKHRAFQAAEAALRAAENRLDASIKDLEGTTFYNENADLMSDPWGGDINNPDYSNWAEFTEGLGDMELHLPPRYTIELVARGVAAESTVDVLGQEVERGRVFRVTALGWGSSEASQVILQSFYMAND